MPWPLSRLDEVAEVAAGNPAPQEPSDFAEDGHIFVRMQDVGREHHTDSLVASTDKVSASAVSQYRLRLFPVGSLLIPKSGASVNLNHRAMLGCDAYVVSHLAVVLPDRRKLLPEYLYYWSLSYDPRSQAQTTSLPSLPLSLIKAALIPVPPLDEQCRIVDLLARADGIVRLRREAEKKTAELIPTLFLDMFGDPATNPKGWPTSRLDAVLTETKLGLVRGAKEMDDQKPFPYLRMDVVGGGVVRAHDLKRVDATEKEAAEYSLRYGDFLFNTRNSKELVGKTGMFVGAEEPVILFNNNLMRMRFDDALLLPEYVNALFQTSYVQNQLEAIKRGTTSVFAIYYKDLRHLELRVPPLHMQHVFARHVCSTNSVKIQQHEATMKAKETFDALLASMFAPNPT